MKNWRNRRLLASNRRVTMEGQSSVRKQAKFSRRILCSSRRILRSPMPNEHPAIVGVRTENKIWVFTWYTLFLGFQYPPVLAYTYKAIVLFQQPSCNLLPVFCYWLFYSLINTFWPSSNDWLPEHWKALLLIVIVKYSGLNTCLSICHTLDSSTDTDKYPYSQDSCLSLLFKLV